MCTRWIAILASLSVVVVATGCAAMMDQEDEGTMSPQPVATALVITGSQVFPTPTPSMSQSTDSSIRYAVAAVGTKFAELLRHSYRAREGNLSEAEAYAHWLRRLLPDDTDVAELASIAALIQQADAGS